MYLIIKNDIQRSSRSHQNVIHFFKIGFNWGQSVLTDLLHKLKPRHYAK